MDEISTIRSKKLSKRDADRVGRAVEQLAASGQGDIERLKGFDSPIYSLRVGDWRVRYCYDDVGTKEDGISVVRVLHRRDAYRKSALARQGIPSTDGFDESEGWEMQERIGD